MSVCTPLIIAPVGPATESPLLSEAIRYRGLGWSIIPLAWGGKRSPTGQKWKRWTRERPRRRQLESWFRAERRNLAVVLGRVSGGLACRDFDDADAYLRWRLEHPDLAAQLPTSRTHRGYHVFFIPSPSDSDLPRSSVVQLADGELRLQGCHATLPPSVHPGGGRYEWVTEPFHGIQMVHSVVAAGLLPAATETGFDGASAPVSYTYQHKPTHDQKTDCTAALYGADGSLLTGQFDVVLGFTLPTGTGMREHRLWLLARMLKSLDQTRWMRVDQLQPIVRHWWEMALPKIRTKEWALTWAAFARAWERARPFSDREGEMADVLDAARRAGCPSGLVREYGNGVGGLVAAICRELASRSADGRFFIDCRTLARLCGIKHYDAAAYLRALAASRVIRVVTRHRRGQATVYEYLRPIERLDESA